jgi:hypothetical protein
MRAGKVYNVFVSLSDIVDKTIIGSPYEYRIPAIETGEEAVADFELLKDAENLTVSLSYNGRTSEKNVYLKQDTSINVIDISSMQFSQEADLSSNATYALTLERFSTSDDVYRLIVVARSKVKAARSEAIVFAYFLPVFEFSHSIEETRRSKRVREWG